MLRIGRVINVIYPSIDKLLTKVGSKYLLVHIASRRSDQMQETGHYQMPESKYHCEKNIGRALEEVMEDLIHVK